MLAPTPKPTPLRRQALRRLRWTPLMWAGICWVSISGLVLISASLLNGWRISPQLVLQGTLTAENQQHDIMVGADIPIADILVQNGDLLTMGQAVAYYDVDLLSAKQAQIAQQLHLNDIQRACLTRPQAASQSLADDASDFDVAIPPHNDPEYANAEQTAIEATCQVQHQTDAQDRQTSERHIMTLQLKRHQMRRLHARRIQSLSGQDKVTATLQHDLRDHAFQVDIQRQALILQRLIVDQNEKRAEKIRALASERTQLAQDKTRLDRLLNDPFLRVERAGTIERLRQVKPATRFANDTAIGQLISRQPNYIATASLSEGQLSGAEIGDQAVLRLSGLPLTAPDIPARLSAFHPTAEQAQSNRAYQVQITLNPKDIADPVWRQRITRHLELMNGRATVEIALSDVPLLTHMHRRAIRMSAMSRVTGTHE